MKQTVLIISVLISLSGIFFIFSRFSPALWTEFSQTIPDMPAGLDADTAPEELSVSPPVPILMYHHIREYGNDGNPSIYVSPQRFEEQLQWLFSHGFRTVGLDYFRHPTPVSGKPFILTFDDGYQDAYDQAFPTLKKYGFQATFYIVTNDMNRSGFLSTGEMLEMKDAGMRFGSHSLSHPNLTQVFQGQAEREIYGSKNVLEEALGTTVDDFCYPGGANDRNVENIVANSGYKTATTTVSEVVSGPTDPLRLNRMNIGDSTRFDDLSALTSL
ncbi:MAG: polysaccharide deacetylase family protein [Candidatus Moraniibacteriota bacterium]